jgi:chromosomal replication initiator protein
VENRPFASATADTSWSRLLTVLRPSLHPGIFDTWFRPTQQLSHEGNTIAVAVPNEMFAEWLRTKYLPEIRDALRDAGLNNDSEIVFVPPGNGSTSDTNAQDIQKAKVPSTPRLNARYTFENFVVSSCNQFAHAAAQAAADQPGRAYNPLFIYGGVGLGKTHLMQAIGNRLMRGSEQISLRYLTTEQFINELITSIRYENTSEFRKRYRNVDVLLIDDIQFIAGKESTQEEFFHTFNDLYDSGRQIVITCDSPPRSIPAVEERLKSRFEWGLIVDIQPPDLETKVAILNKRAAARGWSLPPEVGLFIASNIHSNVRELEGCLTTLMAAASIQRRDPDLDLAREVVRSLVPAEAEPVSLDAILRIVARHFGLKVSELKSKTNARRISFPRQIAMYLGKKLAGESLPTIGHTFAGKHHTTVLHAIRKIDKLRSEDASTHKLLEQLEQQLR